MTKNGSHHDTLIVPQHCKWKAWRKAINLNCLNQFNKDVPRASQTAFKDVFGFCFLIYKETKCCEFRWDWYTWQVHLRSTLPFLETTHWLNRFSTTHILGDKGGKQRLWSPSINFINLFATKGLFGWDLFKNEIWGSDQDGEVEEHEAHLLPQIHQKYIYMLNYSHRISTEHW